MNALLIYPECPVSFWSYTHATRFLGRRAVVPPLGLLTVAALLPEAWDKRLVDLNVREWSDADLAWADIVFVGGMIVQRDAMRRVIERCKAAGKRVVAGGPLFLGEHALYREVDHFVLNEAELTLPLFLADLEAGTTKQMYRTREFADLTQSPVPLWRLADLRKYVYVGVQFSRGCPFDCDFCDITATLGRRPRVKTGRQVIAELDALERSGWTGPVFFVDDNLIGNKPALRDDLLPALIERRRTHGPIQLNTQASINLADDPPLTEQMVAAGFDTVFVGIETPSADALQECGKRQNRKRDLVHDVRLLQRAGLEVQGGFIVGFDADEPTIFQRMVSFVEQSGIVTAMVGILQAPPRTRLAQRLSVLGRLVGPSTGDNTDGTTNISPAMGVETIRKGYAWMLRQLYAPKPYYKRVRVLMRELSRRNTSQRRPTLRHVRAALRSAVWLGILERGRLEYWKLLLWLIPRGPSGWADGVRLALIGHHYRRIAEATIRRIETEPYEQETFDAVLARSGA